MRHRAARLFCLCLLLLTVAVPGRAANTAEKRLTLGRALLANLEADQRTEAQRWQRCLTLFQQLADTEVGDRALYLAGRTGLAGGRRGLDPAMRRQGLSALSDLARRYPRSHLADDALFLLARELATDPASLVEAIRALTRLVILYPDGDVTGQGRQWLQRLQQRLTRRPVADTDQRARVVDIRHGTTGYYSRVVIETDRPVRFTSNVLPPRDGKGPRLYLDLAGAVLARGQNGSQTIDDGVLARVRAAQHDRDTVRVVLDAQSLADHEITTRHDPERIIVDVWGADRTGPVQANNDHCRTAPPTLAEQLGLGARRIILDPGHGGRDPGAVNKWGMREKDICLTVARETAKALRARGYEVHLTRDCDVYLPLEERTAIANRLAGDIFVSLHVNSAESPQLAGIETYYLSLADNADEMRAAAAENAAAQGSLSQLEAILMDLMRNSKINESARLAGAVQQHLVQGLAGRWPDIRDLGVKKAPFIVLVGAKMPAVLAEIAFLSNPTEARRLQDRRYLATVAERIAAGVDAYAADLGRPTAAAGLR